MTPCHYSWRWEVFSSLQFCADSRRKECLKSRVTWITSYRGRHLVCLLNLPSCPVGVQEKVQCCKLVFLSKKEKGWWGLLAGRRSFQPLLLCSAYSRAVGMAKGAPLAPEHTLALMRWECSDPSKTSGYAFFEGLLGDLLQMIMPILELLNWVALLNQVQPWSSECSLEPWIISLDFPLWKKPWMHWGKQLPWATPWRTPSWLPAQSLQGFFRLHC